MKGKQLYDSGVQHVGEKYHLGALVPKNNATYKGAWDCAEFVAWLTYQLTGQLYGCANNNGNPATADAYTGFMKRDADTIGIRVTVAEAAQIPGAFILRYSGSGVIGHIVVSDGHGNTVEAHSTKDGVIKNAVAGRRWDTGILLPKQYGVEYTKASDIVPVPPNHTVYRWTDPLMRGDKIAEIQTKLHIAADGIYGSATFEAVRRFQNQNGLNPDGEVGIITAAALGVK